MKNKNKLLKFLQKVEDWCRKSETIELKISEYHKDEKTFILDSLNWISKELFSFSLNLREKTLKDCLIEIKKKYDEFIKNYKWDKEFIWTSIKIYDNEWFELAWYQNVYFNRSEKSFLSIYKSFIFIFWFKENKNNKESFFDESIFDKKESKIELNEERLKLVQSEYENSEYWYDWMYIDEDFSISSYFDIHSFEDIRNWILTKNYSYLLDNYPNIFSDSELDLYIWNVPSLNYQNWVFVTCFYDALISKNKKYLKFIDEFYKRNKEKILEISRWKKIRAPSIFFNEKVRWDIYSIEFLHFIEKNFIDNEELTNKIIEYIVMNHKIQKFIWVWSKRKKLMKYIKETWDFELKNVDIEIFNWNENHKKFLSFFINYKWDDITKFHTIRTLSRFEKIIWRSLEEKEFKSILQLWWLFDDLLKRLKSKNEIVLFKKIYDFLLKEIERNSVHDVSYWFSHKIYVIKKNYKFLINIFDSFEFSIQQFFSIINVLETNDLDTKRKFSSFKELSESIVIDSLEWDFFNKKEKNNIKSYLEQLLEKSIWINTLKKTLFFNNKEEYLKLTKKKSKFIDREFKKFSETYVIEEWNLIEIKDYFKRLLWTKNKFWEATKPWSLFFELKKKWLLKVLDWDYWNLNEIKKLIFKYSKKNVWFERITLRIEKEDSIWFWCSWDFSNCCMWYNTRKLKTYLIERWFSLITILLWNKIIWNSIIYQWFLNWKKVLVLDNIEMKNSSKRYSENIKKIFFDFLIELKNFYWISEIYQWANYNDLTLYDIDYSRNKDKFIENKTKILWIERDKNEIYFDSKTITKII